MHLTVQTERSDGVAAGSGARGRAGAPAPPSHTGAAPQSRRGCQELQAGRPELLQSGGQQTGRSLRPLPAALPALPVLCGWLCHTSYLSPRPLGNTVGEHGIGDLTRSKPTAWNQARKVCTGECILSDRPYPTSTPVSPGPAGTWKCSKM